MMGRDSLSGRGIVRSPLLSRQRFVCICVVSTQYTICGSSHLKPETPPRAALLAGAADAGRGAAAEPPEGRAGGPGRAEDPQRPGRAGMDVGRSR